MAKLTEEQEIAIWRSRITRSAEMRDKEKRDVWDKTLKVYRGALRPNSANWHEDDPWVSVEKVHSSIRSAVPELIYTTPEWSILPKRPAVDEQGVDMSWPRAKSQQLLLQHHWDETEGNKHVRIAVVCGFLSYGVAKFGYSPSFQDDEKRGEFDTDKDGQLVYGKSEKVNGESIRIPKLKKGEYDRDKDGQLIIDDDTGLPKLHPGTIRDEFFVQWVSPEQMLHDPEGGNVFRNHRYVIEEWVRPIEDVRGDHRYKHSARMNVVSNARVGEEPGQDSAYSSATVVTNEVGDTYDAAEHDGERVRGYDIYDMVNRTYSVLPADAPAGSTENDVWLIKPRPIDPGIEMAPYRFLKFNEDPGKWYPRPDAVGMAKLEEEYNITRSQMLRHRNQSRNVYLEAVGTFAGDEGGELEREKFVSGPDGVLVRVTDPNGLAAGPKPAMDGSYFQAIPNITQDFDEVAGQPGASRGVASADTATEASILKEGSDIKSNDRRDNQVQVFLAEIGRGLLQSMRANSTGNTWVKVARGEKDPVPFTFQEVTPDDLAGEYDVTVSMGSTLPKNDARAMQRVLELVQSFAAMPELLASPAFVRRFTEAMDINDDVLIGELVAIGQQKLQEAQQQEQAAAGQAGQVIGNGANQFVGGGNVQANSPTGAPIN